MDKQGRYMAFRFPYILMVICSMKDEDEDGSIRSARLSILVSHFCYIVY